ncbi:MAG TPA: c-type cytochrome [Chitinophagaceae bacterium]|nr:c-type cytochrome [Chitinophagaceae bacterium]
MKAYVICISALFVLVILAVHAQFTSARSTETLAQKQECFKCHAGNNNKKAIGPTFQQIAEKYRNDTLPLSTLAERVKKGSKGHWTEVSRGVPMPPYSGRLTDAEIRELVEWVMKKEN